MAVVAPLDVERTAIEHDACATADQPAARSGDERGAGAAAAGPRNAGAALPDAQPDLLAIDDSRNADIGAFGKQRIVFEARPERCEIDRLGIGHEECRVRI